MTSNVEVYPLIMEPSFRYGQSTPWGGHALKEKYGKHAPEEITGESLEISTLPGHESRVTNGAYRGKSLQEVFTAWGDWLTGKREKTFPLMLKILDAHQCLSVQVHPDDAYAMDHEGKLGKSEAWYILDAAPGARLVYGIDTRSITRRIRESGVVNACITHSIPKDPDEIIAYRVPQDAALQASCKEITVTKPEEIRHRVVLIDYGAKANIARELVKRGCEVTCVPADTSAEDILAMDPDGIMLSNGPGDPVDNHYSIEQIAKLMGKKPMFGICLGHQMAALAAGGKTYKLKYGHRGANQPVTDLAGRKTYISTQNHGYAVDSPLPAGARMRYINANDGTCEGIDYPDRKCFTVQFHPEACGGPKDTGFLFDRFIAMMEED